MTLPRCTAVFLFFTIATACAPAPDSMNFDPGKQASGPRLMDVDLRAQGEPEKINLPQLQWNEEASPLGLLRLTENLQGLELVRSHPEFTQRVRAWTQSLVQTFPRRSLAFEQSAYADLLVEKSAGQARSVIDDVLKDLTKSRPLLWSAARTLPAPLGSQENVGLEEGLQRLLRSLSNFERRIPGLAIVEVLKTQLLSELRQERGRLEARARESLAALRQATQLSMALQIVRQLFNGENISIPAENEKDLQWAERLGRMIDTYSDAQGALAILVEIWRTLDAAHRQSLFQTASPDLYGYLLKQDPRGLACLEQRACQRLFQSLAKSLVILPQLRSYGLERLRQQLQSHGVQMAIVRLEAVFAEFLRGFPLHFAETVVARFDAKVGEIRRLRSGFDGELRQRLRRWALRHLPNSQGRINEFVPAKALMQMSADGRVRWRWQSQAASPLEGWGGLSALLAKTWGNSLLSPEQEMSSLLSQLNAVAKTKAQSKSAIGSILTARGHAEMVRGLSGLSGFFRDWEPGSFDRILGGFSAQELFPEFPVTDLQQPLFPKDRLLALSLWNVGEQLKTISQTRSQVFLVDLNHAVTWADQFDFHDGRTTVMAGIVDRIQGQRARTVRAADISHYMLALAGFLKATESVEQTRSSDLRNLNEQGERPLDEVLKARQQIKLLLVALANSLSHQFRNAQELIVDTLLVDTQTAADPQIKPINQFLAIRALMETSNALGIELYRWEAADIFFAMNQRLFQMDTHSYGNDRQISLPDLVEGLRAMESLRPALPPSSQTQLDWIMAPWAQSLLRLRADVAAN